MITRKCREISAGHRGAVLWLTGLSGAGKSTFARALEEELYESGRRIYVLDGDIVRAGLSKDLGFSCEDRTENIRRVAEVARLFLDAGFIVVVALITPLRKDRHAARAIVGDGDFHEIYINTPLEICESRDPKELYKRARNGEIKNMTAIDSGYKVPASPFLILQHDESPLVWVKKVLAKIDFDIEKKE